MNLSFRTTYSPYWEAPQYELLPMKAADLAVLGGLTTALERIIRVLEWVRVHAGRFAPRL
jgi:hypothetical protein